MKQADGNWFADEAFWATSYPFMFPETSFALAVEQVDQLVALTGLASGTVLDLACGPGRHSVPLAKRGFRVTGVDRTHFLLDKARAYAAAENVEIEWVQEDMRELKRIETFDLALSLFTSFGYFEAPEENLAVVENVHASLKPGGTFVLDMMGKEVLARIYQPSDVQDIPGAGMVVQRRKVIEDWSRIEMEWIFIREAAQKTYRLRHWLYAGTELKALLLNGGFETVRLFGDLAGAPYGPAASRLVAVARKGG